MKPARSSPPPLSQPLSGQRTGLSDPFGEHAIVEVRLTATRSGQASLVDAPEFQGHAQGDGLFDYFSGGRLRLAPRGDRVLLNARSGHGIRSR